MSAAASLDNLLSWLVQISVIAALGALLPALFRIRHPKSQLAYYHSILLLCLAFPLLQPWQHPLIVVSNSFARSRTTTAGIPWPGLILGIVALGIAAKLFWLGVGLIHLRRYRRSAIPIYPVPQPIREARIFTGADALFCVSKDVAGPATLGYTDPVVLLPASFLSLGIDAQRSVACHELLHVRRNDWLVTLLEEVAGSLLWFHPGVWWLIARAKLTREQVVDAEVVRMNAPAPYIEALLSMAVVSRPRLAVPAAPFFTEGHLAQRMRSLLASPRRSLTRLCLSYACIAFVLAWAGWSVLILFPLNGEAHVVTPTVQRLATYQIQTSGRRLILPSRVRQTFSLKLPAPTGETRDMVYFTNGEASDPAGDHDFLMVPPPPPPPPPPSIKVGSQFLVFGMGVRALRPGQRPSPEEIQNFIASFPKQSLVEVIQEKDGTVSRVMITRRPSDETTSILPGPHVFDGVAGPASTAGAANGVH